MTDATDDDDLPATPASRDSCRVAALAQALDKRERQENRRIKRGFMTMAGAASGLVVAGALTEKIKNEPGAHPVISATDVRDGIVMVSSATGLCGIAGTGSAKAARSTIRGIRNDLRRAEGVEPEKPSKSWGDELGLTGPDLGMDYKDRGRG